jgi:hypothetical protein
MNEQPDLDQCSICLEQVSSFLDTLPCSHSFHKSCLGQWIISRWIFDERVTCAYCRAQIPDVEALPCVDLAALLREVEDEAESEDYDENLGNNDEGIEFDADDGHRLSQVPGLVNNVVLCFQNEIITMMILNGALFRVPDSFVNSTNLERFEFLIEWVFY